MIENLTSWRAGGGMAQIPLVWLLATIVVPILLLFVVERVADLSGAVRRLYRRMRRSRRSRQDGRRWRSALAHAPPVPDVFARAQHDDARMAGGG